MTRYEDINTSRQDAPEEDVSNRYLTFWADQQLYGIGISDVVQIVGMQEITRVPDALHYMKGVISLRGEVFPVLDVRLRLGRPEADYDDRTCIIVVRIKENTFGLIVDEVDEVCDVGVERIAPPPRIQSSVQAYLSGIARREAGQGKKEKLILLINIMQFLGQDAIVALEQAAAASAS